MQRKLIWLIVLIAIISISCSGGKKLSLKRMYHNTTAKYNAFYLANFKLLELENEIKKNHQEDYSKVLPIFYQIDSSTIEANADLLVEVKEMASKSIEWHKISKWVDDSYFLLGMADYYKAEFDDALNTFKYLNVNSKDRNIRHKSLAQLLRIFVDLKKYDDAAFVIDFLSKETKISKENKLLIYKSLAHFYENRKDINGHIGAIDQASKFEKNKKDLSRLNFILAQLYQNEGLDALAYDYYKKASKGNPPYERSFFAQLYAQKVAVLNKSKDAQKVREYYASLYKDTKNKDLKDVILFEQALFELKQNNIEEAELLLIKASQEDGSNKIQKGYIYEKLALLSLDNKKDYRTAKFMVDSALMFFKPSDMSYENLNKIKPKLDEFVKHFDLIQKNDSLIFLSSLSKEDQQKYAQNFIKNEEEKLKLAQNKKDNKKANVGLDSFLAFGGGLNDQSFYFQNTNAVQQGALEFNRVWGNRPVTDNWRRSSQGFSSNLTQNQSKPEASKLTSKEGNDALKTSSLPNIDNLLADIPKNPEEIEILKQGLEYAYFEIGKLLLMELKEKNMSVNYLENLITSYPNTSKKAEALYLLFLANSENRFNQELYVRLLNSEFPQSPFTHYVNNPTVSSGNVAFLASSQNYKEAYELFKQKSYSETRNLIQRSLETYPLTKNTEKFLLLDAMVAAKIDSIEKYIEGLEEFIKQAESLELKELAKKMLLAVKGNVEVEQNTTDEENNLNIAAEDNNEITEINAQETIIESPYKENPNQTHIFVIPIKTELVQATKSLLADLEIFHSSNFSSVRLRTGNMNLNQDYTIFLVSPFSNKEKAVEYKNKFIETLESESLTNEDKKQVFIISIENFQELNRRKNIEEYKTFYLKNY